MRRDMECVEEAGGKLEGILYMPQVSDWSRTSEHTGRSRKRFQGRAETFPIVMSMMATASVYCSLAVIAYDSRGYFAVGGELAIAFVIGFLFYQSLKKGG